MHEKLQHLSLALVSEKCSILLFDNARPHVSQIELEYETLPYPTYSSDLSPTYYRFSSTSRTFCKRISSSTQQQLKMSSKSSLVLELRNAVLLESIDCFLLIKRQVYVFCWQKYIDSNYSYFD
ncbi:hypothetical protein NPIL_628461 [Nephila pilipes]|uniref:Uncharacterized protein n=1 Tax=Nephila pilipes TaxID=299642 RepID=A0A8X6TI94_NEPPI|nr:hypothetical protein NPIL_628461 [Nephila pilipes]